MSRVVDRLAIRAAKAFGLDPCWVVTWVDWVLSWPPEVRAVRREILRRVVSGPCSRRLSALTLDPPLKRLAPRDHMGDRFLSDMARDTATALDPKRRPMG